MWPKAGDSTEITSRIPRPSRRISGLRGGWGAPERGRRVSCPGCGNSFIWSDCFHSGDTFIILDHVKSRLGLRDTSLRRHDARGDVDLLGRAVGEMSRRLGLDPALNGVPRHTTLLPRA